MSHGEDRPYCFGKLETVFPLGEDGLRHSPATCILCPHKTECLRTALKGEDGVRVETEHIDRSYESGSIGFWERWSRRKLLERRKHSGQRDGKQAENRAENQERRTTTSRKEGA